MVVVAVQVLQDLPTVRTDIVLTHHVFTLNMFVDVGAPVTPVVALTAGIFLDVLVDSLSVNMQGDLEVGAEVTLITLKLFLTTSLTIRW